MNIYNVVALNGPPQVGKDTIAKLMYDAIVDRNMNKVITITKFAEPLKLGVHAAFGIVDSYAELVQEDYFEDRKDTPLDEFFGMTPREAYIWFSEDVMKPRFGNFIFGQLMAKRLSYMLDINTPSDVEHIHPLLIIADSGFMEELQFLEEIVGANHIMRIRIMRTGHSFQGDSRSWFKYPKVKTVDLINNGTVDDLEVSIKSIVNDYELYV